MSLKAVALLALATACSGSGEGRCGPSSGVVARAVDGDTLELEDGTRIRYLLVDTNELSEGTCYAQEAFQFNESLVAGKTVELEYDVECTDRFGRLLAYVTVDGRDVNRLLLERGYACVLYIAPDGKDRKADYEAAEVVAQTQRQGMWGYCPSIMEEVACDK